MSFLCWVDTVSCYFHLFSLSVMEGLAQLSTATRMGGSIPLPLQPSVICAPPTLPSVTHRTAWLPSAESVFILLLLALPTSCWCLARLAAVSFAEDLSSASVLGGFCMFLATLSLSPSWGLLPPPACSVNYGVPRA